MMSKIALFCAIAAVMAIQTFASSPSSPSSPQDVVPDYYVAMSRNQNTALENRFDQSFLSKDVRGGGGSCSDSTPILLVKLATSSTVETILMYGLLWKIAKTTETTLLRLLLIVSVTFGSSTFGNIVDSSLNAATRQVLAPNQVPGDPEWYSKLKKPKWNPPGWLFPIMWLIISKPTQVIAVSKLLDDKAETTIAPIAVFAYCFHLALGDAWNKTFFGLQCIGRGVFVITTFWAVLWTSSYLFYKVDPMAGLFLTPTCGWVTVAAALNWSIYLLNKN